MTKKNRARKEMLKSIPKLKDVKLAIDLKSLLNITWDGVDLKPIDLIELFNKKGMLLYNSESGNAPIQFSGEFEVKDVSEQNNKE